MNLTIKKNVGRKELGKAMIDLVKAVFVYREMTRKFLLETHVINESHPTYRPWTTAQSQLDTALSNLTEIAANLPRIPTLPPQLTEAQRQEFNLVNENTVVIGSKPDVN